MKKNYVEDVYAGVLGKIIGVYMGRPFEGWCKADIEAKWGAVNRYVHEDNGVPLIVPDDDITGTFTFIRALEDSGLYEKTPTEFFGDTWLNYIVENKSILWWGGVGLSTEHTAYCNLKAGIKAPRSGSMTINGQTVAEQIGAQIFIDGFGLVCPGKPKLAAELAKRAGSVSHDGEAVYAAQVVAAMVAAAFEEKNMDKLLDIGVSFIPKDSLIAQLHSDVRKWAEEDVDWHKTFERISERYGYKKYGGNCHIIPNHAIMVMAWVYAPDNFLLSQTIINTAGWDTDCNAANVGCLMGVKLGLEKINEDYDFQGAFADRVIMPTAEGTRGVSDALREALYIAKIGSKIMGYKDIPSYKSGAIFHFSMPGALHGFMPEEESFETRGNAEVSNVPTPDGLRAMQFKFKRLSDGTKSRISTPIAPVQESGGYDTMGASMLSPGTNITLCGCFTKCSSPVRLRLYVKTISDENNTLFSDNISSENKEFKLSFKIPEKLVSPIKTLGIELTGSKRAAGTLIIDSIQFKHTPEVSLTAENFMSNPSNIGWIYDINTRRGTFSDDEAPTLYFGKNLDVGVYVTGSTDWKNYKIDADVKIHIAKRGGIIARYQGLKRYVALVRNENKIQLIKEYYGTTVMAEKEIDWQFDNIRKLALKCVGSEITAFYENKEIMTAYAPELMNGGAGLLFEKGLLGIRKFRVSSNGLSD